MKNADFTDDRHKRGSCLRWCKIHYWWDFDEGRHYPYPQQRYWKQDNGWVHVTVHCGPPAYCPKKREGEQK